MANFRIAHKGERASEVILLTAAQTIRGSRGSLSPRRQLCCQHHFRWDNKEKYFWVRIYLVQFVVSVQGEKMFFKI